MTHRILFALISLLLCASASGQALDTVSLETGKPIQGRIVQIHDEDVLHIRKAGEHKVQELKRKKIASVAPLVRERIQTWLDTRKPQDSAAQRWSHVKTAEAAGLPAMARLQAYHVLCKDPSFTKAHDYLGHRQKGKNWKWGLDTTGERAAKKKTLKFANQKEFDKEISKGAAGLSLESENYRLETNTSLDRGVELMFDLERTYCVWLENFGEQLGAAETTWDPDQRMIVRVYRGAKDGFTENPDGDRAAYYSASQQYKVDGSPNVIFTYYANKASARPVQFFDLAVQQLLFTTLGLGHPRSAPPSVEASHWAHWVESGLGWWLAKDFGGRPGYATYSPPRSGARSKVTKSMAKLALQRRGGCPLRNVKKEITNLIGLPWQWFYTNGDHDDVHHAKARALVAYLMEIDPIVKAKGKREPGGSGRSGLMGYLRGVFRDSKSHSSSEFDKCLGGKVESLHEGWKDWLLELAN